MCNGETNGRRSTRPEIIVQYSVATRPLPTLLLMVPAVKSEIIYKFHGGGGDAHHGE